MNLKFICPEGFEIAAQICTKIQLYLPNLLHNTDIIRTEEFRGIFDTQSILPMINRIVTPEWDKDIILVVITGSLYFEDLELFDAVGLTLDYLPSKNRSGAMGSTEIPKIGGQFLPNNMSNEQRADAGYWAKLGVEEILHYFNIPEKHDVNCFFHAKAFGEATIEDSWKDYCPKCREFMLQIKDPVDFVELFDKMEEIFGIKKRGGLKWFLRSLYESAKK